MAGHRGQPTKLTAIAVRKIIQGVKLGMPLKFAAQRAGVTERSVQMWLADARKGANGLKASLLSGIKHAEGDFIAQNLKVIDKAAKNKNWQAGAWLLERRYNEFFSANKAEYVALRKQVAELLKQLAETRGTSLAEKVDPPSESPSLPTPDADRPENGEIQE